MQTYSFNSYITAVSIKIIYFYPMLLLIHHISITQDFIEFQ